MAIGQVVTGGLGTGTLTTTIPLVLLRGLTPVLAFPGIACFQLESITIASFSSESITIASFSNEAIDTC